MTGRAVRAGPARRSRSAVMGIAGSGRFADRSWPTALSGTRADGAAARGRRRRWSRTRPAPHATVRHRAHLGDRRDRRRDRATGGMTGIADGLGWLLGDQGSGFWLGRAAAAATARALYRGCPPSPLTDLVTGAVGETGADALVAAVYDRPPRELAALAPLVTHAALAGDPLAAGIVRDAAARLVATLRQVRGPGDRRTDRAGRRGAAALPAAADRSAAAGRRGVAGGRAGPGRAGRGGRRPVGRARADYPGPAHAVMTPASPRTRWPWAWPASPPCARYVHSVPIRTSGRRG